jgi:hypothetical protein
METYSISVGSASDYEDLIAEIIFHNRFGIILSQEKAPGDFQISVHSFIKDAAEDFDFSKNKDEHKIPLTTFCEAIQKAKQELISQLKTSGT